jgi:hypothetical protein
VINQPGRVVGQLDLEIDPLPRAHTKGALVTDLWVIDGRAGLGCDLPG